MRALKYFVEEALASLWRGRRSTALSVMTIAAALFVLGAFALAGVNLQPTLGRWMEAAEMSVYLRDRATEIDRAEVERILDDSGLATEREFVPRQAALERFRRDFSELAVVLEADDDHPLPASYEVRVGPAAGDAAALEALARELSAHPAVADVRYDRRWIERLLLAVGLVRGVAAGVVVVLMLAAALTVTNVVRLSSHARRDEIEIMHLVGAPLGYIRGPFVVEGALQGGMGAAAALVSLWLVFEAARARWGAEVADVLGVGELTFLPAELWLLLLAGGMGLGCAGGMVASRSAI